MNVMFIVLILHEGAGVWRSAKIDTPRARLRNGRPHPYGRLFLCLFRDTLTIQERPDDRDRIMAK